MDRQRLGLWGTVIFASLAAIGMAIQVYLIAGFIFGETGWLDTHKDLGMAVHLCYILTFLSALVAAWPNWRATLWPFVLAALGSVQAFLAAGGDVGGSDGAVHAFHGMLAPVVFVVALYVAWQAWLALKATPQQQPASTV